MADVAAKRLNVPVHFEISIENVDKPPLDFTEMEQRAAQFAEKKLPLWFTAHRPLLRKRRCFQNPRLLSGPTPSSASANRSIIPANRAGVEAAMERIANHGCRFLVFGRVCDGKFETLVDLSLPDSLRRLCDEVPVADFREDVSSTELRRHNNAP